MSKPLDQWIKEDISKCKKMNLTRLSTEFFFRDPQRPNYIDNEHFYSPCDGTIMYQKHIDNPSDKVVEIKGINYTLQDVIGDKTYNKPSLVVGVFLSFYDPHIIRIPYGGVVRYKQLEPIESTNRPMLAVEKDLLNQAINPDNMDYLKYNERMLVEVYSSLLDYTYYITLIADEDVNVICPFVLGQNKLFSQNQRFALVRWGSMSEIIMPIDDRYDFEIIQPDTYHVEAGTDPLIRIINKNKSS